MKIITKEEIKIAWRINISSFKQLNYSQLDYLKDNTRRYLQNLFIISDLFLPYKLSFTYESCGAHGDLLTHIGFKNPKEFSEVYELVEKEIKKLRLFLVSATDEQLARMSLSLQPKDFLLELDFIQKNLDISKSYEKLTIKADKNIKSNEDNSQVISKKLKI